MGGRSSWVGETPRGVWWASGDTGIPEIICKTHYKCVPFVLGGGSMVFIDCQRRLRLPEV